MNGFLLENVARKEIRVLCKKCLEVFACAKSAWFCGKFTVYDRKSTFGTKMSRWRNQTTEANSLIVFLLNRVKSRLTRSKSNNGLRNRNSFTMGWKVEAEAVSHHLTARRLALLILCSLHREPKVGFVPESAPSTGFTCPRHASVGLPQQRKSEYLLGLMPHARLAENDLK